VKRPRIKVGDRVRHRFAVTCTDGEVVEIREPFASVRWEYRFGGCPNPVVSTCWFAIRFLVRKCVKWEQLTLRGLMQDE
jgi:hypothetical protein